MPAPIASGLTRFLNDPKNFSGNTNPPAVEERNPVNWLKKLDRLKTLAHLNDQSILIIAADHLVDKAENWYDTYAANIGVWSDFRVAFQKKYCSGKEDLWWDQVKNLKQGDQDSIEDIEMKLRELFSLLQVTDEKVKIPIEAATYVEKLINKYAKMGLSIDNVAMGGTYSVSGSH
ncbi:hypothetical protein ABG067_008346 [Albugo candida]